MVICRPACEPLVSPAQPCSQPPSPSMMLGPTPSSAAGAGEAAALCDLLFQPRKTPPAVTTRQMAMTSFPFMDPIREVLLLWMDAKLGMFSSAGAAEASLGADTGDGTGSLDWPAAGSAGGAALVGAVFSGVLLSVEVFPGCEAGAAVFAVLAGCAGLTD